MSAHGVSVFIVTIVDLHRQTHTAAEKHLRLAQRYYVARVTELRELIASEETKFKYVIAERVCTPANLPPFRKLVAEIDEIRSGAWDDKILASTGGQHEEPEAQEEPTQEPQVTEPGQPDGPEEETKPQEEEEAVQEVVMVSLLTRHTLPLCLMLVLKEEEEEQIQAEQPIASAVESPAAPEAGEKV